MTSMNRATHRATLNKDTYLHHASLLSFLPPLIPFFMSSKKRPLEADLPDWNGGWVRVTTQIVVLPQLEPASTQATLTEKMPFRAYQYLLQYNPALGYTSKDKKRMCNIQFNFLDKHVQFLPHMNRPVRDWFALSSDLELMGHWRQALIRMGVTIDMIMGDEQSGPKRVRLDPSLPHAYAIVRAGRTSTFHFNCAEEQRVRDVQQSIKSVAGGGSEDQVEAVEYLLSLLCGENPQEEPECADRLRGLVKNIQPQPGEWVRQTRNTILAQPTASYTFIARGWM